MAPATQATAAAALRLDVAVAWLRGVHLFAYYGGNQCRDEGDLLDAEDAIYVRPRHKVDLPPPAFLPCLDFTSSSSSSLSYF